MFKKFHLLRKLKKSEFLQLVLPTVSPLVSLGAISIGTGFLMTLLTVRMEMMGASTFEIALLSTTYYGGFVLGSFRSEPFLVRVGHIRAYAVFGAITAIVAMLHGLFLNPWSWIVLRFIGGYCLAGLYIVIESWLLIKSAPSTRGRILSFYMISLYASQSLGQLFLRLSDMETLMPFCIITIFCSLSIIPLSMTKVKSPIFEKTSLLTIGTMFKISPSSVLGSLVSGMILGSLYGLFPSFLHDVGSNVDQIAILMSIVIFGGMLLQYPIGLMSDLFEKRSVMTVICILLSLSCILIMASAYTHQLFFTFSTFLFGGFAFVLYPLSITFACDTVKPDDIVATTGTLFLAYGIGATVGPFLYGVGARLAPYFPEALVRFMSPIGLFVYIGLLSAALGIFIFWRRAMLPAVSADDQANFVAMPRSTPVVSEFDPRIEEGLEKE